MLCGIDTCLTSVGIGTEGAAGVAASAGGVRIVAAASSAKRLEKRISLYLRANSWRGRTLIARNRDATAVARASRIFDERRGCPRPGNLLRPAASNRLYAPLP